MSWLQQSRAIGKKKKHNLHKRHKTYVETFCLTAWQTREMGYHCQSTTLCTPEALQ